MRDNSNTAAQAAETEATRKEAREAAATSSSEAREAAATSSSEPENTNVPAPPDRRSRALIQTVRLDSRDFRASWPTAIASLEQLSGWAVLALRLGTLALIQQCVRELAEQDARADVIVRLRALTDALAHMPLET
jgi:hypothetical protein